MNTLITGSNISWTSGLYGSNSFGASGSTTGSGYYVDYAGNVLNVPTNSNRLQFTITGTWWSAAEFAFVPSVYNVKDATIVSTFTLAELSASNFAHVHRFNSGSAYLLNLAKGSFLLQVVKIPGYSVLAVTASAFVNPASSDLLRLTTSCVTVSGHTVCTITLYDITTSSQVSTLTFTDLSNTGPQTIGYNGAGISSTGRIQSLAVYNSSLAQFSISPVAGLANRQVTIAVSGLNTNWSSNTFTVSGGTYTGFSQNVTSTTSASLTFTPTQLGVYVFTDTLSGATNYFTCSTPATGFVQSLAPSQVLAGTPTYITYSLVGGLGLSSNLLITPAVSGVQGVFGPTVTTMLAGSITVTSTFTPSSAGVSVISCTYTGGVSGMTSPGPIVCNSYTYNYITVGSTGILFSPANWVGDLGRTGSQWMRTWNNGAYLIFNFNASSAPICIFNLPNSSTGNTLALRINGTWLDQQTATSSITLTNYLLPSTLNIIEVYCQASPQISRWNGGTNTLQVSGFLIDNYSSASPVPQNRPWVMFVGDSIWEGIEAGSLSVGDNCSDMTFAVGQQLRNSGYEYCISSCGYEGFISPGDSSLDVPGYYSVTSSGYSPANSRWNLIDQGVSMLDSNGQISSYGGTSTTPALFICELGINDFLHSKGSTFLTQAITGCYTALRGAAPNSWLIQLMPFGIYSTNSAYTGSNLYSAAITNGMSLYKTMNPYDYKTFLADFGSNFSKNLIQLNFMNADYVHPNGRGHTMLTGVVGALIANTLKLTSYPSNNANGNIGRV